MLRISDLALVESLLLEVLDKIPDSHRLNFTTKGQKKRLKDKETSEVENRRFS